MGSVTAAMGELRGRRILYAVSTMGLGHAMRTLPLIRHLLAEGAELVVASHGRALEVLRTELPSDAIHWESIADYPPLQRGRGLAHYLFYFPDLFGMWRTARTEAGLVARIHRKSPLDAVISDGRFGFVHPDIPCFLVSHQIRFLLPLLFRPFQRISDEVQRRLLRRYHKVLIPDLPDPEASLTGELCHNWITRAIEVEYIGPTSTLEKRDPAADRSDESERRVLFVMGGFIEAERERLVRKVGALFHRLPEWEAVFMLGGGEWEGEDLPPGVTVIPLATGASARRLLENTPLWVGRTGSTTLMDVRAAGVSGVFVPTPGMTEQEYLARRMAAWGHRPPPGAEGELIDLLLRELEGAVYLDARQLPEALRLWTSEQSLDSFHRTLMAALE